MAAEGNEKVSFTKASAQRIADAVRGFEAGGRDGTPFVGAPRFTPEPHPIKMGTFDGSWPIDSWNVVTDFAQGRTHDSYNLFADITECDNNRPCAIARYGTAWYLIAAKCQ